MPHLHPEGKALRIPHEARKFLAFLKGEPEPKEEDISDEEVFYYYLDHTFTLREFYGIGTHLDLRGTHYYFSDLDRLKMLAEDSHKVWLRRWVSNKKVADQWHVPNN